MTKKELKVILTDLEIYESKKIALSQIEQFDSDNVYRKGDDAYVWKETDLSNEDVNTMLLTRQTREIISINNKFTIIVSIAVLFFVLNFLASI